MSSTSDTMTEQQQREAKVENMNKQCVMKKGKPTYHGLTRRQWIDRLLEVDPTTSPRKSRMSIPHCGNRPGMRARIGFRGS